MEGLNLWQGEHEVLVVCMPTDQKSENITQIGGLLKQQTTTTTITNNLLSLYSEKPTLWTKMLALGWSPPCARAPPCSPPQKAALCPGGDIIHSDNVTALHRHEGQV